jgi:hypothetical protein
LCATLPFSSNYKFSRKPIIAKITTLTATYFAKLTLKPLNMRKKINTSTFRTGALRNMELGKVGCPRWAKGILKEAKKYSLSPFLAKLIAQNKSRVCLNIPWD